MLQELLGTALAVRKDANEKPECPDGQRLGDRDVRLCLHSGRRRTRSLLPERAGGRVRGVGQLLGFLAASGLFLRSAVRQRRLRHNLPWFLTGLALFCFVVAMEEISWGQRIIGYRPPVYFLEHNFQQELNLHNVVDTSLRKLGLKVIILGYGVVLPIVALAPGVKRLLDVTGIVVPPASMIPSFLLVFATYQIYPWKHSGEWVELMLGLGFLFVALATPESRTRSLV